MSLYYPPAQSRQPHNSYIASTTESSAGPPSFRLTCVNVNHVTYNYLMENATSNVNESSFNYGNACGGSLPCYQSLTSALQQPQEVSSPTRSSYSLPSSCESPMSLPAFSPPTAQPTAYLAHHHHHQHYHQQQTFHAANGGSSLFQEDVPHLPNINEPSTMVDFNIDEDFPFDDLGGEASSDDDGNFTSYKFFLADKTKIIFFFFYRVE